MPATEEQANEWHYPLEETEDSSIGYRTYDPEERKSVLYFEQSFFCSSPSWSLSHWQYCLGLLALELLLSVDRCCLNFHKLAQVLQLHHYRFSSLNMCPSGPNSFPQSQNQELRKQRLAQPHRIPRSPGTMSGNIRWTTVENHVRNKIHIALEDQEGHSSDISFKRNSVL